MALLDSPYASPLLTNVGLGLLAASRPMPVGQNRMAPVMQGLNTAQNQIAQMKQMEMQRELMEMKREQAETEKQQRNSMLGTRSALMGGHDPNTGITWESGRAGMGQGQQMGLLAQAFPEQMGKGLVGQMFETPKPPETVTDAEGYRRYLTGPQAGQRVFPDVRKSPEKISGITLEPPGGGPARTFSRTDPEVQARLDEGWVEAPRTRRGEISANRVDELRADRAAIGRARAKVAEARQAIKENRGRAGAVGSVKRLGQKALGIALDLADVGVDVVEPVQDATSMFTDDIRSGRASDELRGYFDPALSQMEIYENSLAYMLARARKGTGRLNKQDVENAKNDTKMTGLTSVDDVLARLDAIDREFAEAGSDLDARLGDQQKASRYSEMSDEDLKKALGIE